MFNKQKKLPEDMTDAEMGQRLSALKGKIAWINKYVPRITIGFMVGGVVAAGIGVALMASIGAPLILMSAMVGAGALGLVLGGGAKSECENEICMLSDENKSRIEIAKLRKKAEAAAEARALPQAALKLRDAFDAAIEAMGKGIENSMTVRRPLRLKTAPGMTA
ncbi:MAG: hypothetical protein EPN97_18500 [Alphaproteobacteria bacterium]|nr:MAG: hypothetical protein EPN97_18500 [Alphaproteobacteria bacterium]